MNYPFKFLAKPILYSAVACILALGAAQAYASENTVIPNQHESHSVETESENMTAESTVTGQSDKDDDKIIIQYESILVMPNANKTVTIVTKPQKRTNFDMRNFDLIEDNPLFVGAVPVSEFDKRQYRLDAGSYPKSLNVDPLVSVAGAGISTSF